MPNAVCEVLVTERQLNTPHDDVDLTVGAVVDFWGIVRGSENGREIAGIEYEAHREMAEHQLRQIARQAAEKFALTRVVVYHRIGFIAVGHASLFLRVASHHRAEAFNAGQWIVDELKKKVPIWKKPAFGKATAGKPGLASVAK